MGQSSKFALEQHRVYLLERFERWPNADIVCSGFARSNPEKVITALFRSTQIISEWQDTKYSDKLPWPLEVVSFHAKAAGGRRFRFSLTCLDFHREWESEWPELI